MGLLDRFIFKVATESWELDAILRLNYKTFVEEIPQHHPNDEKKLVDKFHQNNTYIICVNEEEKELAGMIAFRGRRPFSLDAKLENLDSYLPKDRSLCEIRLLAVEEKYRYTRISQGLIATLVQYAIDQGHDLAVISGTLRQVKLYGFLGFVPFGPVVGTKEAPYQPMYLTLEAYKELKTRSRSFAKKTPELANDDTLAFNFLPGPVDYSRPVGEVLHQKPCSHRAHHFIQDFEKLRQQLCRLANAKKVQVLMGPGTLANDAIAGQLARLQQPGLVLVNGEFGRRLVKNAQGARLDFNTVEVAEGATFQRADLEQALQKFPDAAWIWSVHCETSTGVLNDLDLYKSICTEHQLKLCLDGMSSLGTIPVDLTDVYLASASSGKGLASLSGLSMVFYHHQILPAPNALPCVLDLGVYEAQNGIPYTIQSHLVHALLTALDTHDWPSRFETIRNWSQTIRKKLRAIDARILAPESCAMPSVVTIVVPKKYSSEVLGNRLKQKGVLVSYRSRYLLERNWIQACMMGAEHIPSEKLVRLLKEELDR